MASLSFDKKTQRYLLQFTGCTKKRHTIRLGKVSQRMAENFRNRVETLIHCQQTGTVHDSSMVTWLNGLDESKHEKLVEAGIAPPRQENPELGTFLENYLKERDDVKVGTIEHYARAVSNLKEHFGSSQKLSSITPADAEDFRRFLLRKNLAENTIRRRCGRAKQFFKYAVSRKLIPDNPFEGMKTSVGANRERFYFVTVQEAEQVLAACPNTQWRLLFALARYGGLRCPSETLSLKWEHVNWEHGRIVVPSPKTEHHENGASRVIRIPI